jgi:S1-C subfamily serine protease
MGWSAQGIAVVVGCLVATSCGASPADETTTIAAATMRVRADGCGPRTELGTATAIGDGIVVTAAHVVAGTDQVTLVDASGSTIAVDVVLFDPDLDVAALRARDDAPPPALASVPLHAGRGTAGEAGVIALVAADGSIEIVEVEVVQRVTIRTTDVTGERDVERPGLRLDAAIDPGDSGAMVHLPGGGVGIVWSRSTTRDTQAWTVDLPAEVVDATGRRALTTPVDTGPCT